ncbi:MAG: bifunctional aspartate transaminase/aspartate 4-decarboxylase [Muribaculaceae bacterium]|nr:bifunctional aspartate transaminase/aspartate 4-decarboxylase [Muribaculaceae bacterium]
MDNPLSRDYEQKLSQMSPFEIKNELIRLAQEDSRKSCATYLNAGRGNPNWTASDAREAFLLLGYFALDECRRVHSEAPGIAGSPSKKGIADRFEAFLAKQPVTEGSSLLKEGYRYVVDRLKADRDELILEWADGITGDHYPTPPRILNYTEQIIRPYLAQEMGNRAEGGGRDYDLFATEGGTAAMCYVFDSLQANHLVKRGDKIALMAPLFTPYIEIPQLDRYAFDVVTVSANKVEADGYHYWQYPDSELDKLRDPAVKLVCLINPSNPPSYRLSDENLDRFVDIVRKDNPNLIVVTDDVYGTFAEDFKSLMYTLPANTLCVYSFSKYFGATGWRLAVVAAHKDNIMDRLIKELPQAERDDLERRYGSLTLDVPALKFIDRMVADSRAVALNHTAGLSTPQQIMMSLFALKCLLDTEDVYKGKMQAMIHDRLSALWENTGFTVVPDRLRVGYYSEIDMMVWAKKFYGEDFAAWLPTAHHPLDVTMRLAVEKGIVVLNGSGFDGPDWSIRTSEANLEREAYVTIGKQVRAILEEYHQEYLRTKK